MMRHRTNHVLLVGLVALGVAVACKETTNPDAPDPGVVTVVLTTPNSNDGGVQFTVSGGPIDSVTAGSHDLYHAAIDGASERVIIIGALAPSGVALLWLPDRNKLNDYELTVEEIAARGTFANRPLSGYALTLVRP